MYNTFYLYKVLIILRSYQIASKLSERLDEMGKDLTTMIEEINDASSTLSTTGKADDPVSLLSAFSFDQRYLTLRPDTAHPSRPCSQQPSYPIATD